MKTFKAKKGPFQERPFYSSQEIEQICIDELSSAGFLPKGYYLMHGQQLVMPERLELQPDREILKWHNDAVYFG